MFARLGQVGDLFGPISSLFSGLALLAVAVTIWIDVSSRRVSRKPLVICQISEVERIVFDEPVSTRPRGVRFKASFDVRALNDVAMNVVVSAKLKGKGWAKTMEQVPLPVPLTHGGGAETITVAVRLDASGIGDLIRSYDQREEIALEVSAACQSLEGIRWTTSVDYVLSFRDSDGEKIKALDATDQAVCEAQWANQVMVQPEYRVRVGSWNHLR
ncbi:hypothetical protein [Shinella zoogloeoides]|uniref:hypothetical protein n=1 Tax=Shinella zoogloeoides TaxID=352475 RepID=UPI001F5B012B|nr:hypothetical protein [Shinella zoogloeoides]